MSISDPQINLNRLGSVKKMTGPGHTQDHHKNGINCRPAW